MRFRPLERGPTLPEGIVAKLIRAIAAGELRPGDRLPSELVLAADFGVARTVVREAISQLRYDGVVQSRKGVGVFIAEPEDRTAFRISPQCFEKRKELLKLLKLRTGIAAEAAAESARLHDEAQLARMQDAIDEMKTALRQAGPEERFEAERRLERAVADASGNEHFVAFMAMIDGQIAENLRSVAVKNTKAVEWDDSVIAEHERVVAAIARRDQAAAREEMRQHYENAARRLADRTDLADT